MTNKEKLTAAFDKFLEYCVNPPEDYPEQEFGERTTYPIHITKAEALTLKNLGTEVINQTPATLAKKILSPATGANEFVITLQIPDQGPVNRNNPFNAGYIVFKLILDAISLATEHDFDKAITTAEYAEAVHKAILLEYPHADQLEGQESLFDDTERKKRTTWSKAIERGALMSIGGYLAAFSSTELSSAFTSLALSKLPDEYDPQNAFDDTGKLQTIAVNEKDLIKANAIQTAVAMAILQAVILSPPGEIDSIDIYLPAFLSEMHIDPRPYSTKRGNRVDMAELRYQKMLEIIAPFDRLVGTLPNGDRYRAMTFDRWERDSETMKIRAPYFFRLRDFNRNYEEERKQRLTMTLLSSAAGSEPNYAAVELAARILIGLERRGNRPDYKVNTTQKKLKQTVTKTDSKGNRTTTTTVFDTQEEAPQNAKVTYKVKYSSLIADCPQVAAALSAIENETDENGEKKPYRAQAYNSKLKQLFEAALRIIMEKSDAPLKYAEFNIPTITKRSKRGTITVYEVPTKSTLSKNLVITHKGKNTDYVTEL